MRGYEGVGMKSSPQPVEVRGCEAAADARFACGMPISGACIRRYSLF